MDVRIRPATRRGLRRRLYRRPAGIRVRPSASRRRAWASAESWWPGTGFAFVAASRGREIGLRTTVLSRTLSATHVSLQLALHRLAPVTHIYQTAQPGAPSVVHHTVVRQGHIELRPEGAWRPRIIERMETTIRRLLRVEVMAVERRVERFTHVATRPREAISSQFETRTTLEMPPVPRVFTRPPTPVVTFSEDSVLPSVPQTIASRAEEMKPLGRAVATGVDVDQLTDHVMRTIDQRLVSARERLGIA